MTEPQDVLAEALAAARVHRADGHRCNDTRSDCLGHVEDVYEAALVRTPETLDVERLARALPVGVEEPVYLTWRETAEAIAAEYVLLAASPAPDPGAHPETYCHRCGGPNVSWHAPSPLWNAVMRGGDINGPWKWNEIICPTCFAVLAEEAGVASSWRLDARTVNVELATVTPSGRVWDPAQDLWVEPAPDPGAGLREALWQCGVESGMDTDGDAGPGALIAGMGDAGFAAAMVEQVRQLRLAYDECLAPSAEPPETT